MNFNLVIIIITGVMSFLAFNNPKLLTNMLHRPYNEHHNNQKYRLLTSGFIHADIYHLMINMFVLYQFGNYVEAQFIINFGSWGSVLYALFYIVTIILANLKTHFSNKDNYNYSALGASGATSAVLFAFIYYAPTSMLGLYLVIPIPAILFGILYLWYSSWAGKRGQDNIGHEAHFYGAVAGFLLAVVLDPSQFTSFVDQLLHWR